ncbi:MAG: glycosyl hydrolase family 65 protein [Candidatus Izemoplasma sp.]|nr:glycosyl hydrolase family 65 protein [Candidatus Izemoplasma sp.]
MTEIGKHLYTSNQWQIIKKEFIKREAITDGSNFMIGNGYLGYRGTFSEDTKDNFVGCILSDTWDNADGKWEELCTVPNALYTAVYHNDSPITVDTNLIDFNRELDIKHGITKRETQHMIEKAVLSIKEEKFASMIHKSAIYMKYTLKSDTDLKVTIKTGLDTNIWSINGHHFKHEKLKSLDNALFIGTTNTYEDEVYVYEKLISSIDFKPDTKTVKKATIHLKENTPVTLYKIMMTLSSNDYEQPLKEIKDLYQSLPSYQEELTQHKLQWEALWEHYDIQISGDIFTQVAYRFNTYHAIIATPTHKSLPIGARGLSCQAYQGAAFWDQEIYNLPMYLHTNPDIAKQILIYRHNTLSGAKNKAQKHGYEGAFYAWISGKTGKELCPDFFFKDVITGRKIRNHFNLWQIHISPDIAYTVNKYYTVTHDDEFMNNYGIELVFEIARFIASRVVFMPRRNRYEIHQVQGPDEYHENIDNNAFTNYQALFTLKTALTYLNDFNQNTIDAIKESISLTQKEIALWEDIHDKLYIPKPNHHHVIEQFDGYFDLETIIPATDVKQRLINDEEYYGWPNGITVFTQCIKQPDVLQLFHLYPNLFDTKTLKANYEFYEPRTLHFSSLSPSIHAILAARLNKTNDLKKYMKKSLSIDIMNTNEAVSGGTFIGGMHTAANAAAWQIFVYGIAGFSQNEDTIIFNPHLPSNVTELSFKLVVFNHPATIKITQATLTIEFDHTLPDDIHLTVNNQTVKLTTNLTLNL